MSRNLAASIRARLKLRADATKQDFNLTLTHYGLERLLYRLSISPHAGNYLLKGALLFSLWYDQPHRPTRDADLHGFGPDDIDSAVAAFREVCEILVDDGIAFDPASVKGSAIRKDAGYGGVRIDLQAKRDGARIALQVDIGFGDAVTPAPRRRGHVRAAATAGAKHCHLWLERCIRTGCREASPVGRIPEKEPAGCPGSGRGCHPAAPRVSEAEIQLIARIIGRS
jgi:hypothetical protein